MNKVILSGTIEKDFDVKSTKAGISVAKVTLKCFADDDKKSFLIIDCVFWGDKANSVSNYTKGTYLEVEGKITKNSYQDKKGNTQWATEVQVDRYEAVGSNVQVEAPVKEYENESVLDYSDEDLPF